MFVEDISREAKVDFIDEYLEGINKGRMGFEKIKKVDIVKNSELFRVDGVKQALVDLEEKNVIPCVCNSLVAQGTKRIGVIDYLFFEFGDTWFDITKETYMQLPVKEILTKFIKIANKYEVHTSEPKQLETPYIKRFILPNLLPEQRVEYAKYIMELQSASKKRYENQLDNELKEIFSL